MRPVRRRLQSAEAHAEQGYSARAGRCCQAGCAGLRAHCSCLRQPVQRAVTPGRLRSAFKALGFAGMVEVALFADILTLKEALDFDELVRSEEDFLLTSCCCPIWIAMIRKVYGSLTPHIPASVSPMIACGRAVKQLVPGAVTVFIGPCVAKKGGGAGGRYRRRG